MFARSGPYGHNCETLLILPCSTESSGRLCMRRKQKKKMKSSCEAHFLKKRRAAVAAATAADTSPAMKPRWLRTLSKKLWTKAHMAERQFNKKKHEKKALLAFKNGLYKPECKTKKRKMKEKLQEFEKAETKKRKVYDRGLEQRCQAAQSSSQPRNPTLILSETSQLGAQLTAKLPLPPSCHPRRRSRLLCPGKLTSARRICVSVSSFAGLLISLGSPGGTDRMKFSQMVVYVGKNVPEQKARDAIKAVGSRVTTNLHRA